MIFFSNHFNNIFIAPYDLDNGYELDKAFGVKKVIKLSIFL